MKTIYLWFYCLSIWKASLIIVLFTVIAVYIFNRYKSTRYIKCIFSLLLLIGIAVVLITTLIRSASGLNYPVTLVPFKSYIDVLKGANKELIRANFMNIILFYPLGLFAGLLTEKKHKKVLCAVLFCALSIFIEIMQYKFGLGYAEMDDVIHNTLGVVAGLLVSQVEFTNINLKNLFRRK